MMSPTPPKRACNWHHLTAELIFTNRKLAKKAYKEFLEGKRGAFWINVHLQTRKTRPDGKKK